MEGTKLLQSFLEVSLVKLIDDRKTPLSVFTHLGKLNCLTPLFTEQIIGFPIIFCPTKQLEARNIIYWSFWF